MSGRWRIDSKVSVTIPRSPRTFTPPTQGVYPASRSACLLRAANCRTAAWSFRRDARVCTAFRRLLPSRAVPGVLDDVLRASHEVCMNPATCPQIDAATATGDGRLSLLPWRAITITCREALGCKPGRFRTWGRRVIRPVRFLLGESHGTIVAVVCEIAATPLVTEGTMGDGRQHASSCLLVPSSCSLAYRHRQTTPVPCHLALGPGRRSRTMS